MTGLAQRLAGPVLALLLPAAAAALEVSSPDNRIAFSIGTGDDGVPRYSVRYGDELVVQESRLGMRFANHRTARSCAWNPQDILACCCWVARSK